MSAAGTSATRTACPDPSRGEWKHLDLGNGSDPHAALEDFAAEAVRDSETFYAHSPTQDYEFDGHTLRFPSPIETLDEVNNTVWGRFFPAQGPLALIVLPQWNAQWGSHIGLCRILQRFGITTLRMSLPYHDHRRPEEFERAEPLIGPNVGQTMATTRQAVLEVRRAADWLADRGYSRLGCPWNQHRILHRLSGDGPRSPAPVQRFHTRFVLLCRRCVGRSFDEPRSRIIGKRPPVGGAAPPLGADQPLPIHFTTQWSSETAAGTLRPLRPELPVSPHQKILRRIRPASSPLRTRTPPVRALHHGPVPFPGDRRFPDCEVLQKVSRKLGAQK